MSITKKLQQSTDMILQFNEDEVSELGWKPNEKLSFKVLEDGSVSLTKYDTMEIDLNDFDREILEHLITISCEEDISVNQVIENILKEGLGI